MLDNPTANHPAIVEVKRLQQEWKKTGVKDPRLDAYQFAYNKARQANLDDTGATIFAAKAVTGY